MIIPYTPQLKITNLDILPRGLRCKYMLVIIAHNGTYIAHSWKRKAPASIPAGYALITFK